MCALCRGVVAAALLAVLVSAGCECGPKAPPNEPMAPGANDAPGAPAALGAPLSPPTAAVTSADIALAERARVGGLERLHAKGIIELRTRNEKIEKGERFEQGDLDLRWSRTLGLAASLSKLGDRWVWLGADSASWWVFELKSEPSRMHTGPLTSAKAGLAPAFPWLMGMRPLLPVAGAEPEAIDGVLRVTVELPAGVLPSGATLAADFDPTTRLPVGTSLTLPSGGAWKSSFSDWMSVETPGAAPGAWPRIPRRMNATNIAGDASTAVRVALDRAEADAIATDRPALYDSAALRERFAPQLVETEQ